MGEDFEQERRNAWDKKVAENTKLMFDTFKEEVESEGCKMSYEQRYGDDAPKVYISGEISDALKTKINEFSSKYAPENFWGQ